MKLGTLDIKKAYLGTRELTPTNAFVGLVPVIEAKSVGLKFTSTGNSSVALQNNGNNTPDVKYSLDGVHWIQWDYSAISLSNGNSVYFKGTNSSGFSSSTNDYSSFVLTGSISVSGNIMYLLDETGELRDLSGTSRCFYRLFYDNSAIKYISKSLLPATTLADCCYENMFARCSNLINVPELPATTLANNCYYYMFNSCSNLVIAPELPATILADDCYFGMFQYCINLTTVPLLSASVLTARCYNTMFMGCTKLNYIKCLATNISANYCTRNWVYGVQTNNGIFVKHPDMQLWTTGTDGIPSGWTVQDAS